MFNVNKPASIKKQPKNKKTSLCNVYLYQINLTLLGTHCLANFISFIIISRNLYFVKMI